MKPIVGFNRASHLGDILGRGAFRASFLSSFNGPTVFYETGWDEMFLFPGGQFPEGADGKLLAKRGLASVVIFQFGFK